MIFYTAVGNRVEEDSGRFVVRVGEQEKVLSEMETMIWAALTWSVPDVPAFMYCPWKRKGDGMGG